MSFYQTKKVDEYWTEYKTSGNLKVLSFKEEIDQFINKYNEHVFVVEKSSSELRYILTVHINPKTVIKKDGILKTKLLDKEVQLNFLENMDIDEKGYYLKTLKMTREDSIKRAIDLLQSSGLSGYVYCNETLTRWHDDAPEDLRNLLGDLD